MPHTSARAVVKQSRAVWRSGRGNSRISMGWWARASLRPGCGHPHVRYSVIVTCRISFLVLCSLFAASNTLAQTCRGAERPRKQFVTVSYDSLHTQPLHLRSTRSRIVGRDVSSVHFQEFEYRTRDELTLIDVIEFSRRQRGFTSIYPFGMSSGPALMLRGSFAPLPQIDISFTGPSPIARYTLTDARALDGAIGLIMADHSSVGASAATRSCWLASARSPATLATAAATSPKVAAG